MGKRGTCPLWKCCKVPTPTPLGNFHPETPNLPTPGKILQEPMAIDHPNALCKGLRRPYDLARCTHSPFVPAICRLLPLQFDWIIVSFSEITTNLHPISHRVPVTAQYWSSYRIWQGVYTSLMHSFSLTSANIAINHTLSELDSLDYILSRTVWVSLQPVWCNWPPKLLNSVE